MFSICYWFSAFLSYIFFIHKLIVQIKTVSVDHSLIILSLFSLHQICRSFILFSVIEQYRLFIICICVFRKEIKFENSMTRLLYYFLYTLFCLFLHILWFFFFFFISIYLGLYLKFNLIFSFSYAYEIQIFLNINLFVFFVFDYKIMFKKEMFVIS